MLQETTKQYVLTREEYFFFADDIIGEEFKRGYILTENKHNSNTDNYILTFTYTTAIHQYYDLFVKWNNAKKEEPYKRGLTFDEMTFEMKMLLEKRKQHFVNPKYYKVYPEYVRVE